MMLKEATEVELALLNAQRPDVNKNQSAWRLNHENIAEKIQNCVEIELRKQEKKYGLPNGSQKYVRKVTITSVENRMKFI